MRSVTSRQFHRLIGLLLGGFFLCAQVGLPALAAEDVFRLTSVDGPVGIYISGADEELPAEVDFPLAPGDRVVTHRGARAEIASLEGVVIELQEDSDMEIESSAEGLRALFLHAGGLFSSFSRLKSRLERRRRPDYQIKTLVAVAAVRGTDLVLALDEQGNLEAAVLEGEVAFSPPPGAEAEHADEWSGTILIGGKNKGLRVEPHRPPRVLKEIPPLTVGAMRRMPHVRERVKRVQVDWKPLSHEQRNERRLHLLRPDAERLRPQENRLQPDPVRPPPRTPQRPQPKRRQ